MTEMRMRLLLWVVLAECFYVQAGRSPSFDNDNVKVGGWRRSQLSTESIVTDIPDVPMDEDEVSLPPPLSLPAYQWVPASAVNKNLFAPERRSQTVPPAVRAMLLPSSQPPVTAGVLEPVELLCRLDQMSVRVRKDLFGVDGAKQNLFLGTCPVNKVSATYYYFFYDLQSCGVTMKSLPDSVVYSNSLCYTPPSAGPVVREPLFKIPVECRFYRFYNSYKVGFQPCPRKWNFFRGLAMTSSISLTAMDDRWKRLRLEDGYILGKPMHFEVRIPSRSGNERVYVSKCHITASPHPNARLQYPVVRNSGCMVDSMKTPLSKFIPYPKKNVLRFTIGSFLFKEMVTKSMTPKDFFLHCEVIVGGPRATPAAKSCTYNSTSEEWQELFGNNAACVCCASRCPAPTTPATKRIMTSSPLPVEYDQQKSPVVPWKHGRKNKFAFKSSRSTRKAFEDIWELSE